MSNSSSPPSALRIGILGCANIAKQFVRDVAPSPAVTVVAAASRQDATASDFARTFGIPRHYGNYEALLADTNIDAIYLPLPNSMHAKWAIQAARAGKHILCEKPLAMGLAEAHSMFDAARSYQVMLLEAFPYYFQPQTVAMLEILRSSGSEESSNAATTAARAQVICPLSSDGTFVVAGAIVPFGRMSTQGRNPP